MRINLQVSGVEYPVVEGKSIVSKTDLDGNIVYVNPYFVEVSGFGEGELLGAPQNIVRHPDMPAEAFADLWASVKRGTPWTGVVKNRRKDGDHYWVLANVTPVMELGRPVGYMSVRTKPSREQVAHAEQAYRQIKENRACGLRIVQGAVVGGGALRRLGLCDLSFSARIGITMGLVLMLLLGLGGAALFGSGGGAPDMAISGATAAGVAVVLYCWRSLLLSIVHPLRQATAIARAIAAGDLSSKFERQRGDDAGQLLRALQQMNVNLIAIVGDVRDNVASIHLASREIAGANLDLSCRTERQAASIEETSASMEQFASTVRQNAGNARQANELAARASSVAVEGGVVVAQVIATMGQIGASAGKVVDVIGLIDGVAFQSNILALNAAVEAARAGEQGRAFGVVAGEVRLLAQRSAAAAKEMRGLIGASVEQIGQGAKLVARAGATMDQIVVSVQRVAGIMNEIVVASSEQDAGIGEVNQAVFQLDEVTQQNAAMVEAAAAVAATLEDQTTRLAQAVSVFKLAPLGARRAPAPAPRLRRALGKGSREAPASVGAPLRRHAEVV